MQASRCPGQTTRSRTPTGSGRVRVSRSRRAVTRCRNAMPVGRLVAAGAAVPRKRPRLDEGVVPGPAVSGALTRWPSWSSLCRSNTRLGCLTALPPTGWTRWWLAGRLLFKIVYMLVCRILGLVVVLSRGDRARAAEVGERSSGYSSADRLLLRPCRGRDRASRRLAVNEGSGGEWCTSTGRHAKGSVRPDLGWQARAVEGRRPAFRGLGDLPREGVTRCPGPAVPLAARRLVWAGDPALRRRGGDLG